MADNKVLYEVKEKVAWITLNRPESLNAVNQEMQKYLIEYCRQANEDPEVQVVMFKGAGEKAFSVGGDIRDRARANAEAVAPESPLVIRQARLASSVRTPP